MEEVEACPRSASADDRHRGESGRDCELHASRTAALGDGVRFGPRRLILRQANADPTRGVIFELYKPELIDVREPCFRLRGIEPMAMGSGPIAAMVQEWLLIVRS